MGYRTQDNANAMLVQECLRSCPDCRKAGYGIILCDYHSHNWWLLVDDLEKVLGEALF